MENIDLKKLRTEINAFVADRDWKKFHSLKNLVMALNVESSELLEIFQWMSEEDSEAVKNTPKTLGQVEDELADIFYFLILISDKTGVDLQQAVLNKLNKNKEKYPVELAKGNSKKYDEL